MDMPPMPMLCYSVAEHDRKIPVVSRHFIVEFFCRGELGEVLKMVVCMFALYQGRFINKLQNDIILLIIKI